MEGEARTQVTLEKDMTYRAIFDSPYKISHMEPLLFVFLNHFFYLPGSIPVLGWLLMFYTLIAGLIISFSNAKLLEQITRLSKALKEVSQGNFEQHLETNKMCIRDRTRIVCQILAEQDLIIRERMKTIWRNQQRLMKKEYVH